MALHKQSAKKQIEEKASSISVGGSGKSIFDKRTLEETPEITEEVIITTDSYGTKRYTTSIYLDNLSPELNYIKRDIIGISDYERGNINIIRCNLVNTTTNSTIEPGLSVLNTNSNILYPLKESTYGGDNYNLIILYSDYNKQNPFLKVNLTYPEPTAE